MVATAAEEARNPLRDIPIASVGSVVVTGSLYVLMATAITGAVYYTEVSGATRALRGGGHGADLPFPGPGGVSMW
jgi:amino acid transporter